jgi:hypothetical protein
MPMNQDLPNSIFAMDIKDSLLFEDVIGIWIFR